MRSLAALGALVLATTAMAGERTFVRVGDAARAACAVPGSGWQRGDFDDRAWALRVMTVRNPNGAKAATAGSAGSAAAAATGNDKAIAGSNRASASARTNAATANPRTDIASSSARANRAPSAARTNDAPSSAHSDNSTSSHSDNATSSVHSDNSSSSAHSDNTTSSAHAGNSTSSEHADNSSSSIHADNSSSSIHSDNSSSSIHANNSSSSARSDNSSSSGHSDNASSSARPENSSSSRADNSTSSGNGNESLSSEASAKTAPPDCLGARFARWHFAVNDLPSLQTITLRIRYSHGFAAYLNGTELARRRLDANAPPDALAGDVHGPEAERLIIPLRAGLLRRGDNVLAVEVHPHTAARESQMEVTLSADDSARIVRGPYLLNVRSNEVTVVFDTDLPTVGELQMGASDRYGAQRSDGIGVHHVLRIDGLNAGSIYHYRVRARSGTSLRVGETDDARGAIASAGSDAHARSTARDKNARIQTSETESTRAHESSPRANEQDAHVSGNETVRAADNNVRIAANDNSDVVTIEGARVATNQNARVATNQNARVATNQNARVATGGDDRSVSDDRSVNDDRSAAGDRSSNDDSSADDQPTAPIDSAPTTPILADSGDALFHTPADAGRPLRFAVYGDVRSGHDVHATLNRALADDEPDFAILTGDLVDRGSDDGDWERFFEVAGPLLRQLPIFPAIGNHEYASRGHGALAFMRFFRFPVAGESEPSWYSFDEGSAHFVALDSNQYKTSRQLSWLERDLKEARKRGARAIFVYAHEGPFSSGIHGDNSVCARDYVPIFERYKVSMLFTGHDHDFERGRVNDLDYIVTGGGGAELRSARCGVPGKRACPARVITFVNDHNYVMVELLPSLFRVCPKHVDGSPLEPCTVYPLR